MWIMLRPPLPRPLMPRASCYSTRATVQCELLTNRQTQKSDCNDSVRQQDKFLLIYVLIAYSKPGESQQLELKFRVVAFLPTGHVPAA